MRRRRVRRRVELKLPPEFLELCKYDMTTPEIVLEGFIADLCRITGSGGQPRGDGYISNGSDEREFARAYYDRVGYPYHGKYLREELRISEVRNAIGG